MLQPQGQELLEEAHLLVVLLVFLVLLVVVHQEHRLV